MRQRLWEIKEVLEELWVHEQSLHLLNLLWAVPSFAIPTAEGAHDPHGRVWAKAGIVHWTVHHLWCPQGTGLAPQVTEFP